jgi:hypothetical protein
MQYQEQAKMIRDLLESLNQIHTRAAIRPDNGGDLLDQIAEIAESALKGAISNGR